MRTRTNLAVAIAILSLGLNGWLFLRPAIVKAQAQAKPPIVPIDQHWRIVPGVLPDNLEGELKKLNAQGIAVTQAELVLVGDKFTIMIADSGEDEEGK